MTDRTGTFITASIMFSLLGTGLSASLPDNHVQIIARNEEQNTDKIYETSEWKKLVRKWSEMDKVKVKDFEEISIVVEKEKKSMSDLYESLIKKGYLSETSSYAIELVYGENLRSTLEGKVQLPCCYEPVMTYEWDCNGIDTRDALNKKLYLVDDLYKKGTVKKEILDKARHEITARLDLLDKADKYWQTIGEGKCEEHPEEVDVILHLYDMNAGGIKDGKKVEMDLFKASEYIVELEKHY